MNLTDLNFNNAKRETEALVITMEGMIYPADNRIGLLCL